MFIALVVTSGLQGSDRGQMVSVNGEDTLALALTRCIESESYRFDEKTFVQKKCKRPVIIHFYSDKDDKYSSLTKIEDLVAGSLKANFVNAFAELLTIHLISDTEDKKDDRICGDSRLNACLFYNITSDKKSMDDHVCRIKQLLDLNKQIPLLVNINIDVTDSTNIIEELGEEAEIVNHKQVLDHIIDKNGSLDEL
ncbi:MAG TPA: hypothetical protein VHX42_00815, partial [Candidatus Babeliales bacterium]|nr:hypothetical protein [Candidatus Babeliales bacterium]